MYKDEMNYANKSKQERQEKGQFFTPELVIDKMFKYVKTTGTLLDNSMGSGNILAYAIQKRGFEPSKVYGIEFDPDIYDIAVERLTKLGVPKENLVLGDALSKDSYRFGHLVNYKHFDLAVINPPYKLGNKVAIEALSHSDSVVCLMPLSKLKPRGLWKKITNFEMPFTREMTQGGIFESAIITPNLSISVLENEAKPKFENENNLTLEGYSKDFLEVYKWNMNHKGLNGPYYSTPGGESTDKVIATRVNYDTTFAISGRAVEDGIPGEGANDYEWNNKKTKSLGGLLDFYEMPSAKAKDNLTTWWYYKGKKGLANSLLKGLNKASGSCEDAIPQINWEEIENTEAWKSGDYDTAVLDMMNLKMVDGKVVKKSTALFDSEEMFEFESFDPKLRPFYDYNKEHWGQCLTDTVFRGSEKKLAEKKVNNKEWFAISYRAGADGVHSSGFDFDWNHKTQDTIIRTKTGDFMEQMLKCKSERSKDNLVKWFYYAGKSGLANKVLKGLNTDCGTLAIWSIPQIDFSIIENNPLWQEGKYDEAVLDMMGLKMTEDGKIVTKCI